jgi:MerR family transcriptional regulator, copper efflux regulator
MNIGEAATAAGLPAKTIRYYESIGLLPPPPRSDGNYRVYSEREVATLRFIQRARQLGFPLQEIGNLLSLWQDRNHRSADVKALAEERLREIDIRIAELQSIRATLQDLVARCHGDDRPDCPILADLEAGGCHNHEQEQGR